MILMSIERVMTAKKGVCVILTDETPSDLEISGADVDGLDNDYVLAAGSLLIAPDADYMAFEDGVFTQKHNTAPADS